MLFKFIDENRLIVTKSKATHNHCSIRNQSLKIKVAQKKLESNEIWTEMLNFLKDTSNWKIKPRFI